MYDRTHLRGLVDNSDGLSLRLGPCSTFLGCLGSTFLEGPGPEVKMGGNLADGLLSSTPAHP